MGIGGQLGRARWASTGMARESTARERPGPWPFGPVPCPCQAPGRAWAGEAARGTSTGPARLVGWHVCGPFKRTASALSLAPLPLLPRAAALSLAPLLSRAAAAAALLRPSRPPPQRCSPGRRRSSLLSPPVLPPSLPQRHRRPEPRRRGTRVCIPSTARPQLTRLRLRLRRPLPPSSTVTPGCRRRRSSAAAPRRPLRRSGPACPTARHGTPTPSPGRARAGMSARRHCAARHGGAAVPRRARAGRARAVPVPCGPVGHLYQYTRALEHTGYKKIEEQQGRVDRSNRLSKPVRPVS